MDAFEMLEEKYHLVVTAGYSLVVAVIVLVQKAPALEKIGLWVLGVLVFGAVLGGIRKGIEPKPKFEL